MVSASLGMVSAAATTTPRFSLASPNIDPTIEEQSAASQRPPPPSPTGQRPPPPSTSPRAATAASGGGGVAGGGGAGSGLAPARQQLPPPGAVQIKPRPYSRWVDAGLSLLALSPRGQLGLSMRPSLDQALLDDPTVRKLAPLLNPILAPLGAHTASTRIKPASMPLARHAT